TSSSGTWTGATTSTASLWGECFSFIFAHFLLCSLPFSTSCYILSATSPGLNCLVTSASASKDALCLRSQLQRQAPPSSASASTNQWARAG
ncbi:unnamed protein product, partial [Tetraodon nigroviridis]